jgi:multiple sugar transport system substrate-binding protein
VTIELARFFGACDDTVGDSTDLAAAVGECEAITTLENLFNAENPYGITVERLGGAEWASYYDTLNAAFAGGEPPDVAIMHTANIPDYAQRSQVLALTDLYEPIGIDIADAVPESQEGVSWGEDSYAVPFDLNGALAHVNVDLFAEAGLVDADGRPTLPTSPEEFLEHAQAVQDATGSNYVAIARVGDNLGWHTVHSLIMQQGSSVLNDDRTAANVDTPEARTAIEFVTSIFESGYADGDLTIDAANQQFLNGEAAMTINGTWMVETYLAEAPFTYEAHNFPTLYDEPAVWANSHTWVIPVQQDADPVKYRAALEFAKFLYDHDLDWGLKTGHIPVRTSVLESDEYTTAPQRANYAETGLTIAHQVPEIPNYPAIENHLVDIVENIWFNGVSVDEALQQGQAQIDSDLNS